MTVRSGSGHLNWPSPELTETPRALTTEAAARELGSDYAVTSTRGGLAAMGEGRGPVPSDLLEES